MCKILTLSSLSPSVYLGKPTRRTAIVDRDLDLGGLCDSLVAVADAVVSLSYVVQLHVRADDALLAVVVCVDAAAARDVARLLAAAAARGPGTAAAAAADGVIEGGAAGRTLAAVAVFGGHVAPEPGAEVELV